MKHLIDPTFQPTWIEDQSSEDYHADKSAVSSSPLRKILKSPATFYSYFHEAAHEETEAMRLGSAFHLALLEPKKFFDTYKKQPDFGDLRSPKNRTARDEWKEAQPANAVILTEADYIRMEGMLNSVLKHRDATALLKHGQSEVSGFYADPMTGIKLKIKPDFIDFEKAVFLDVKTTTDCTADEFSKSCWKYRYDFQVAMYAAGIKEITGISMDTMFLAIEKLPPYEVALYMTDDNLMKKGMQDYQLALIQLKHCIENNNWPSYQTGFQIIQLPKWALAPFQGEQS